MDKQQLIDAIMKKYNAMQAADANETFVADLVGQLTAFFPLDDLQEDDWIIAFFIRKVEHDLIAETNQPSVPEGLYYVWIMRVLGEVLKSKQNQGKLPDTLPAATEQTLKAITEGDTRVEFAVGQGGDLTGSQRIDAFIAGLCDYGRDREVILRYRQLCW